MNSVFIYAPRNIRAQRTFLVLWEFVLLIFIYSCFWDEQIFGETVELQWHFTVISLKLKPVFNPVTTCLFRLPSCEMSAQVSQKSCVYDESECFSLVWQLFPLDVGICAQFRASNPVFYSVYALLTVDCTIDYFGYLAWRLIHTFQFDRNKVFFSAYNWSVHLIFV